MSGPRLRFTVTLAPVAARPSRRAWRIVAACLLALAPVARAQVSHPWRVDVSLGAFLEPYNGGSGDDPAGALAALRISRRLGPSFRGVLSVAGARTGDFALTSPTTGYDIRSDRILLTAGPAIEVPVSRVRLVVSLETGATWTRMVVTDVNPPPGTTRDEWSIDGVLVPGVEVRLPLTERLSVTGRASNYFIHWLESAHSAPAFGLGVAFQP